MDGEVFNGQHAAIVDQETYDAVQAKLTEARNGATARSRSNALLSGLLICGQCGSAISPHHTKKGTKRYRYYFCGRVQRRGARACPGGHTPMARMDADVVDKIRSIGRDPAVVSEALIAARAAQDARRPDLEAELRNASTTISRLEDERGNLVAAIGRGEPPRAILNRLHELEAEIEDANERRVAAQKTVALLDDGTLDEEDLVTAIRSFGPVWEHLFPAERQRIVQLLVEHVTYTAESGEISIRFRPAGVRALLDEAQEEAA